MKNNKISLLLAVLMVMGNASGAETDLYGLDPLALYGGDSLVVGDNSLPAALQLAELLEEERLLDFGEMSEDGNPLSASSAKNSLVCDYEGCGEQFKYSSLLERHKERKHKGENIHQCGRCNKIFPELSDLEMHERVHNGENPYECYSCGKCFQCPSHLKRHSKVHTGKKDYSCSVCGKTFIQKAHKEAHEKVHTPKRPYKCDSCPERFRLKKELKSHSRIHTGRKLFQCGECSKSFTLKSNLERHSTVHTGEKPFSCGVCNRSFANPSNRNKHEKIHDKDPLSSNPREDESDDNGVELAAADSPVALVEDEMNGEQNEE